MPTRLHLRQRLFAWMMSGGSSGYEDDSISARYKRRLFGNLHGEVIEIGPGGGASLEYLKGRDVHWVGIEPNTYMHLYLKREAARLGFVADIRAGSAEKIDAPDASADAVISSLVLCSVPDQAAVLREVLRVLKPGGQFVFIEHVAARGGSARRLQNLIRPIWQFIGDGCQPNRETWVTLQAAGFAHLELEHFRVDAPIVSPHIAGVGTR
ncbi:MAG TPA: class I SAM-dependent methyltransferase [Anaerolineae bacterium]|jgi:ubiquinone/menaquinone biosynthesis C-methylase UbiE